MKIELNGVIYDSITGFFYNSKTSNRIDSSYSSKGGMTYCNVYIGGLTIKAHRLAWEMVYGLKPVSDIDHINGDGSDNRILNLRCVTKSENQKNQKLSSRNKSGIAGVLWRASINKYEVTATVNKCKFNLGYFSGIFDAACARKSFNNKNGFTSRHG